MVATSPDQSKVNSFQAPAFKLLDTNSVWQNYQSLKEKNGIVVAFICNHCPYVVAIIPSLIESVRQLQKLKIGFVAICSNDSSNYPADSYENMKIFAENNNFNFPYLHDEKQKVANDYGAVCTPDFLGFDNQNILRYRGRLNSIRPSDNPNKNVEPELVKAMEQLISIGKIEKKIYPTIGCSIKWAS